ncbi:enoyl-CoA hydratase/isomerase family protein [Sphingobium sp. HBC34]|uniref:Enoyl-CoA hydratase/isomerase family protein n=1 Tax=Sphingobium cyanobacteriorum TaxID=3063954 RepID=A0ABT8ZP52_9SPHN|nr:enoyl-CoA hydratase/isomerase family protein [Sphingobium sp. HBC34]MDO7836314.1 enoyl-CoA hydratase/isomerase family protein [Sphingobium sp. HBC34]
MTDSLIRHDEGAVCTLMLNRPAQRNAIDHTMLEWLQAYVPAIAADDSIACVVLRGAGASFCAGVDLNSFTGNGAMPREARVRALDMLAALPQPVIAAVHGHCMTGGLELALMADIIVADHSARFADTHGRWGLVPGWGMSQRLPRRIGAGQAAIMSYTGRVVEAEEAHHIGLIDMVAGEGELDSVLAGLTGAIVAGSPFTVRHMKRLFRETAGMMLADGLAHERATHPGAAPDMADRVARFTTRT